MKIAICQLNPVVGDIQGNCDQILRAAHTAKEAGCDLVVCSELALTGYPPRDLLEREDFIRANLAAKDRLIREISGIGIAFGYVEKNPAPKGPRLCNAAVLAEDGVILSTVTKTLLPEYDVFDERRYFAPGSPAAPVQFRGKTIGITICEDAWNTGDVTMPVPYDIDPVDVIAPSSDILLNLSASPFHAGKIRFRDTIFSGIARRYGIPVVHVNQTGANDMLIFDGASAAYGPDGRLIARAAAFATDAIIVDTETLTGPVRPLPEDDLDRIYEALVLGTRDYLAKCGFTKAVIGSSGGIDSALTAAIAVAALGPENVTTVFMPSRYTDDDNYQDTRELAENLGVKLDTIPIGEAFNAFINMSPLFDAEAHGVTEQNIQARIRGTLLMAYANTLNAIVLTTGNKAEVAVGYCTLYGDMNGGLAVLGDLTKTRVWDLSCRINETAGRILIPRRIIEKPPTAELKPGQTDQDDLPPYAVVDAIVERYIEAHQDAETIIAAGFDREAVEDIIRRIRINEYKRQQAAPILKVTDKNFGYGRRYPIACRIRY